MPLPIPCFKMFLERSLNEPPPPHFKHLSLLPLPIHHPFLPLKNFDHTHSQQHSPRDITTSLGSLPVIFTGNIPYRPSISIRAIKADVLFKSLAATHWYVISLNSERLISLMRIKLSGIVYSLSNFRYLLWSCFTHCSIKQQYLSLDWKKSPKRQTSSIIWILTALK